MSMLEEAIPQIRQLIKRVDTVSQRRQCATSLRNALKKLRQQKLPSDLITDLLTVLTEFVYAEGDDTAGPAVVALGHLFAQEQFPKDSQDFVWDIISNMPSSRPNMSMEHTLDAFIRLASTTSLGDEKADIIYSIALDAARSPITSVRVQGVGCIGLLCAARAYDERKANEVVDLLMCYALGDDSECSSEVRTSAIMAIGALTNKTMIPEDRREGVINFLTSSTPMFRKEKCFALSEMVTAKDWFPANRLLDAYKYGETTLVEEAVGGTTPAHIQIEAISVLHRSCVRKDFPCQKTCDDLFGVLVGVAQNTNNDDLKVECLTGLSKLTHNGKFPPNIDVMKDVITLAMRKAMSKKTSVQVLAIQVLCRFTYSKQLPESKVNAVARVLLLCSKEANSPDTRKWAVSGLRDLIVGGKISNSTTLEAVRRALMYIATVDKKAAPLEIEYALRGIGVYIESELDRFKTEISSYTPLIEKCLNYLEQEIPTDAKEERLVDLKTLGVHIVGAMLKHDLYPLNLLNAKRMLRLLILHVNAGHESCTLTTLWAIASWIPRSSFPDDQQSTINVVNLLVNLLDSDNLQFRALDALCALFMRKELLSYITDVVVCDDSHEKTNTNDDDNASKNQTGANNPAVISSPSPSYQSTENTVSFAAQIRRRVQEKYDNRDTLFKCGGKDPLPKKRCVEVTKNMERILEAL